MEHHLEIESYRHNEWNWDKSRVFYLYKYIAIFKGIVTKCE